MEYGGCREEHELCRKHAQWTGHSYDPCFQRGSLGLGKDWLRPSTCQWGVGSRGLSLGSVTLGPVSSSWPAGWFLGTAGSVRFGSAGKVTWNVSDSPEKPRVPSTQLLSPEGGLASAGRSEALFESRGKGPPIFQPLVICSISLHLHDRLQYCENDSIGQKGKLRLKELIQCHQFSSVAQSCPTLCDPMTAAHQATLSITNSQSLLKLMSIESVMPSNHLILCCPLLPPSIFPTVRVFSSESVLRVRWPKY